MKLLLDTRAALWWLADDPRLGAAAALRMADGRTQVLLSAAVAWEVGIKRSLGKLEAPSGLAATLLAAGAVPLPVTLAHAEAVAGLPWHHRDPFDRMLVAQALEEDAVLVTRDEALRAYGVPTVW